MVSRGRGSHVVPRGGVRVAGGSQGWCKDHAHATQRGACATCGADSEAGPPDTAGVALAQAWAVSGEGKPSLNLPEPSSLPRALSRPHCDPPRGCHGAALHSGLVPAPVPGTALLLRAAGPQDSPPTASEVTPGASSPRRALQCSRCWEPTCLNRQGRAPGCPAPSAELGLLTRCSAAGAGCGGRRGGSPLQGPRKCQD